MPEMLNQMEGKAEPGVLLVSKAWTWLEMETPNSVAAPDSGYVRLCVRVGIT